LEFYRQHRNLNRGDPRTPLSSNGDDSGLVALRHDQFHFERRCRNEE